MEALSVHGITIAFGALVVLRGVSMTIERGERRAIIGPNGAGKTTLFNIISGSLRPGAGQVYLDGVDVTRQSVDARARRGLGRTYQRTNLFPGLTVAENIRLAVQRRAGLTHSIWTPVQRHHELQQATAGLLERFALEQRREVPVRQLSHGEQRQLELALALAINPRVLLLDEPTAGMSPAETAQMVRLLQELPENLTLVLVEHDLDAVWALAQRITVLHNGEVLAEGSPAEIRANTAVREAYLGEVSQRGPNAGH